STPGVRRRWSRRRSPARSTRRAPPWRACPRPVVPAISEPTPLSSGRYVPFRSGSWGGTGRSRAGRRRVPPTAPHGGVSSPPPPPNECRHATARPAWTTRPFGHPRDTASIPAGRGRPGRRSRAERPGGSLRQLRVERTRLGERRQHFGLGGGDHRGPLPPCIEPTLSAPGVVVEGAFPADGSPPVGACLLNVKVCGQDLHRSSLHTIRNPAMNPTRAATSVTVVEVGQ